MVGFKGGGGQFFGGMVYETILEAIGKIGPCTAPKTALSESFRTWTIGRERGRYAICLTNFTSLSIPMVILISGFMSFIQMPFKNEPYSYWT